MRFFGCHDLLKSTLCKLFVSISHVLSIAGESREVMD